MRPVSTATPPGGSGPARPRTWWARPSWWHSAAGIATTLSRRDAGPWLFGIATNMISRHRQAEVRLYRALARADVDAAVESPADEVVARVAATSQRRAIAAALARLKSADRDTLLLVDWAELSYDQAALALHVPVGTVRSRLNRARRKIREALDDINSTRPEEHSHD